MLKSLIVATSLCALGSAAAYADPPKKLSDSDMSSITAGYSRSGSSFSWTSQRASAEGNQTSVCLAACGAAVGVAVLPIGSRNTGNAYGGNNQTQSVVAVNRN